MGQRARKELRPSDITVIVDTREQRPWDLAPLKMIEGTLSTGDYSVVGLQNEIVLERKSLGDLLGCIGGERERFEREIKRMQAYPCRAVIVEASWADLHAGKWRQKVKVESAVGSVYGWIAAGVPFVFADSVRGAGLAASRILFIAARRRFYELGAFYDGLKISG